MYFVFGHFCVRFGIATILPSRNAVAAFFRLLSRCGGACLGFKVIGFRVMGFRV